MKLHKTGHPIADTVSDLIGELPSGNYRAGYGILRRPRDWYQGDWFEVDKGYWGAGHYDGNYRISYRGTQAMYEPGVGEPHGLVLEPWLKSNESLWTMIFPPTAHVAEFFDIDPTSWMFKAIKRAKEIGLPYMLRTKAAVSEPIPWEHTGHVITFNSTLGIEAVRRGIPVISDPDHSTVGNFCRHAGTISGYDREPLFSFLQANQFKLTEKEKIWGLIEHSLSTSGTTAGKLSVVM